MSTLSEGPTGERPPGREGAPERARVDAATKSRFVRIEELFHAARALDPARREGWLDRACGADRELRGELAELLAHAPDEGRPPPPAGGSSGPAAPADLTGMRLGTFRLLAPLGEGGMGAVFEAEQDHPRRRVALKVLHVALGSAAARARFEREIQLLADLQHRGIARILEAGVEQLGGIEVPWFAMELVRGLPLDEHVRVHGLDLRQKLLLVARVCDAVHHAHQRGVVHRDLKPANVLVVLDPDEARSEGPVGQPKIVDFGIARALSEGSDAAGRTRPGQLLGTLAYMSPEQVDGSGAELDRRTDVWSLGVILYELVCGAPPHDLTGLALTESVRRIREHEPPRPSSLDAGLRGDVETIVLHALARERERRYRSAAELASDLRRTLHHEPILARPPSAVYLLRKGLRRHRGAALASLALFASVLAFAFFAQREAREKTRLAAREERTAHELALVAGRLEDELAATRIERGYLYTRLGSFAAAEEALWSEWRRDPGEAATWALFDLYQRYPCLGRIELGEPNTPLGLIAHPDGRRVFSADEGGVLRVHDLEALDTRVLGVLGEEGFRLAVSARHGLLFQGAEGVLVAYDLETLRPVARREQEGLGGALALTPDGERLLCGTLDGSLLELEPRGLEPLGQSRDHGSQVTALAFAADGARASGDLLGTVVVRAADGALEHTLAGAHDQTVSALAFSPDGTTLASGGRDKIARLWERASGRRLAVHDGILGTVRALTFTGERTLLVGGWWSIDVWDASTGGIRTPVPLGGGVWLRLSDGRLLSGHRSTLRLWSARLLDGALAVARGAGRTVARFARGGAELLVADSLGRLTRSAGGAQQPSTILATPNRVVSVVADDQDGMLWVGENDRARAAVDDPQVRLVPGDVDRCGTLRLLDARGEERLALPRFMAVGCRSLAVAGGAVLLARWEAGVELRQASSGTLLGRWPVDVEVVSVSLDARAERAAWVLRGGEIRVCDLASGACRSFRESTPWVTAFDSVAGESRSTRLVVARFDGTLVVWNLAGWRAEATLVGHRATVWDLAFRPGHPDVLATASADGTVRLWSLARRACLMIIDEFDDHEVTSVDFSADGRQLLVATSGGAVRILDMDEPAACLRGNMKAWTGGDEEGDATLADRAPDAR